MELKMYDSWTNIPKSIHSTGVWNAPEGKKLRKLLESWGFKFDDKSFPRNELLQHVQLPFRWYKGQLQIVVRERLIRHIHDANGRMRARMVFSTPDAEVHDAFMFVYLEEGDL